MKVGWIALNIKGDMKVPCWLECTLLHIEGYYTHCIDLN